MRSYDEGMAEDMSLGDMVKAYRLHLKMSQKEFAKHYGYETPTAVSLWERSIRSVPNDIVEDIIEYREKRIATPAKIAGMEAAKSRVLRRTEIPKDAKNPTRDYVVILGEEIAGFIDDDIDALKYGSPMPIASRGER